MSIKKNHITPSSLKYRMPAEWEEHEAIWLSWPHDSTDYPNGLDKVQETYIQIIKAISIFERVKLCVKDNGLINKVKGLLRKENVELGNIVFHVINYNDIWIRDYGPIFIVNQNEKKLAMTHWIFNAWGDKYVELKNDTIIPSIINQSMKIPCFTPGIVLEGGSIDVNGKGTLITTKQCLLNERRNPNLSGKEIEFCLMEFLGVEKIIWLNEGIAGDDTDGHIDDIARFVNPTTLLCAYENDKDDENHDILKNNYEILKKSTDQNGNKFTIIKLPMPGFVGDKKARLPATYTNFYIGNNVVLVPVFGHKNDQFAMDIIQDCFPTRKIVGIDCLELVHGLGTIHCICQQQPAIPEKTL